MIAYTKKATENMVILVGGGIRDGETAYKAAKAGGDLIVTGTIVEETEDVEAKISEITTAIKKASE
jgi:phosphoglycerol geranylgeranyltransferase